MLLKTLTSRVNLSSGGGAGSDGLQRTPRQLRLCPALASGLTLPSRSDPPPAVARADFICRIVPVHPEGASVLFLAPAHHPLGY